MQTHLEDWLTNCCQLSQFVLEPMQNDASFRCYYRVRSHDSTWVLMDTRAELKNGVPFVSITRALRQLGLQTPDVFFGDTAQGLLLISDFGSQPLLKSLTLDNATELYHLVLNDLATLQTCRETPGWSVPSFTGQFMLEELELFKEWFLSKHLGLSLTQAQEKVLRASFQFIVDSAVNQPQVFMHRDFHSANLMVLENNQIGILDFQDAFIGPVTYDLVSLLRDCYISWPETLIAPLVLSYRDRLRLSVSDEEFLRWFDLMGLQRHLKALLTFSRKFHRDHNPNYLQHIPRTLNYILSISARYPECQVLSGLLQEITVCAP